MFEQSTATDSAVINVNDAVQPIFSNCTFSNNTAFRHGGVVYCRGVAKAVFNNCTLQQNEASAGDGGVAYLADGSSVELRGCEVVGNKAHSSGVLFAEGGSALITGCVVWNNQADVDAGVLTVTDGSSGMIVDSKAWYGICSYVTYGHGRLAPATPASVEHCAVMRFIACVESNGEQEQHWRGRWSRHELGHCDVVDRVLRIVFQLGRWWGSGCRSRTLNCHGSNLESLVRALRLRLE